MSLPSSGPHGSRAPAGATTRSGVQPRCPTSPKIAPHQPEPSRPLGRDDAPRSGATLAGLDKLDRLPAAAWVHRDRGDDTGPARALLDQLGFDGAIARRGVPAPVQGGARWVVERTHAWMNGSGKLRRCTAKRRAVMDF